MNKILRKPGFWIDLLGLAILAAAWILWYRGQKAVSVPALAASLAAVILFALVCLRFVPVWMRAWSRNAPPEPGADLAEPPGVGLRIFALLLGVDIAVLLLTWAIWRIAGEEGSFREYLDFWRCLDSGQYLDIVRDWYPSEGDRDALVRLVFLPGYPVLVRLVHCLVKNDLISGLIVSGLAFPAAGVVLYRLLRLDLPRKDALRGIRYLCLLPGVFFFAAPMSDGLFLLLCALCLYLVRKRRWIPGCLCGGAAAFTRSLGLSLLIPLVFLLAEDALRDRDRLGEGERFRRVLGRAAALLLVPAGFGVYCWINYRVSGDPFKFMEYQSEHWHQHLGWFFNTAAYQMDYAVHDFWDKPHVFLGLWLPNLLFSFGCLTLMFCAAKKLRPGYTAWFIGYYAVAYGATWLLSGPRYLIALIPVPTAMALVTQKRAADILLTVCCSILAVLYFLAFVLRWQVW
ncbi:MAG: hypothetical protein IKG89_09160 [Oscillospiraceae bacterium]|nr:hypothetical protein [Oscillospiraceae bacterium]